MILVNGQQAEQISVRDRAVQYGDGLFETFAVDRGQILAWDRHIARLQSGCERLGIICPDSALLESEAALCCADVEQAVLKLIVSRGEGGRGYQPPQPAQATRIFSLHDWPDNPGDYQHKGIEAGICPIRLGHMPTLAGIKHLNRLEQVLIRQALSIRQYPEAVVMDINNIVIEGSMSNIFLLKKGVLKTPDLSLAGVEGVVRGRILEISTEMGLNKDVGTVSLDDVLQAEEVFFCNSILGIWPVVRIAETVYKVGPCTQQLQQQLMDENLIIMT